MASSLSKRLHTQTVGVSQAVPGTWEVAEEEAEGKEEEEEETGR